MLRAKEDRGAYKFFDSTIDEELKSKAALETELRAAIPMEEYLGWSDDKGRLYDPWLRSHTAAGGKIIKPADRSMVVEEPIAFWEMWSGREFANTGEYAVEGALAPVAIDRQLGLGKYVEPNVWFAYAA
jgi:hypothetical protein